MSDSDFMYAIAGAVLGLTLLQLTCRLLGFSDGPLDWLNALVDWVAVKLGAKPKEGRR